MDLIASLPAQVLWGARQCGKSSLLARLSPKWSHATLDDLFSRRTAQEDPSLFLKKNPPPVVIDEAQYAPALFPEIKAWIDRERMSGPLKKVLFRLSGSQQVLVDSRIKESLGGRASFFRLHGFSFRELGAHAPSVEEFIFRGAWPELVVNPELSSIDYLNDYLRTVVDKDVALSAGVRDLARFQRTLGLLAARVGELLNFEGLGAEAGVTGVTLKAWIGLMERSGIAGILRPYHTNLNKRLIKTPKFYFLDTGLATRLQGHLDVSTLFRGPQFGHLFENLVLTEILKTRDHHRKSWNLFFWRSKDGEEYDFLIDDGHSVVVLDAQVAIQSARPLKLSPRIARDLGNRRTILGVCTYGGPLRLISDDCLQVPVAGLGDFLLEKLR